MWSISNATKLLVSIRDPLILPFRRLEYDNAHLQEIYAGRLASHVLLADPEPSALSYHYHSSTLRMPMLHCIPLGCCCGDGNSWPGRQRAMCCAAGELTRSHVRSTIYYLVPSLIPVLPGAASTSPNSSHFLFIILTVRQRFSPCRLSNSIVWLIECDSSFSPLIIQARTFDSIPLEALKSHSN